MPHAFGVYLFGSAIKIYISPFDGAIKGQRRRKLQPENALIPEIFQLPFPLFLIYATGG